MADAAFALKSGEVSAPVKGRFSTVLLQAGKIEPGSQKSYEDVAAQLIWDTVQRALSDLEHAVSAELRKRN